MSILEPASAAVPVRKLFRNLALALVLAMVLGGGLLWVLGKFDDRFASLSELAEDVPERVIGQVLDVPLNKPERQMRREVLAAQKFEFLESFRSIRSAMSRCFCSTATSCISTHSPATLRASSEGPKGCPY